MKFIIEEKDVELFREISNKMQKFYEELDDMTLDVLNNLINDSCQYVSTFNSLLDEINRVVTALEDRVK